MLGDLYPIIHDLPNKDIKIYPIGDLHYGSQEFDGNRWNAYLDMIKSEENSYIVLLGDLIDNGTKSSVTNCFRQTCPPHEQKRWLADQLKPVKDRILCAVSGNHESRNANLDADDNPMYDVMAKLDIEDRYRENGCFIALRMAGNAENRRSRSGDSRPTYTLFVTHGAGGGALIGGNANKTERFSSYINNVDIFLSGHSHKPMVYPSSKLNFDLFNKKVTQKTVYNVVVSSFLNYGGYPIKKMLPPSGYMPTIIELSGTKKHIKITC